MTRRWFAWLPFVGAGMAQKVQDANCIDGGTGLLIPCP